MTKVLWLIRAIVLLFLSLPVSAWGQSIWVGQGTDRVAALEVLKPDFDAPEANTTLLTSAVFGSVRLVVGEYVVMTAEVPFAHYGDADFDGDSESAIGNPYLGLAMRIPNTAEFLVEVGIRAPLAPDEKLGATLTGIFTDIYRMEAFVTDVVPIDAAINYRYRSASGLVTRLRSGGALWLAVGERDESEFLLAYSGQVGYESSRLSVLGGLTGRAVVTEGELDFGESTAHEFGGTVAIALGNVYPGAHFRLPLDETLFGSGDVLDFVFGLNVSVELP
jgi:hypothetical protein